MSIVLYVVLDRELNISIVTMAEWTIEATSGGVEAVKCP